MADDGGYPVNSYRGATTVERVGRIYFRIEENRVFKITEREWALGSRPRSWSRRYDKKIETGLEIGLSELEGIGLQADKFGEISLRNQEDTLTKTLKTTGKYILGIGVPLVAAYFVADYLFDGKVVIAGLISLINGAVIHTDTRIKGPEYRKVKRVLERHAGRALRTKK